MNHLLYWKIRNKFGKFLFLFKKLFYKFSVSRNKAKLTFSVKRSLFKDVLKHLIINGLFFVITLGIDYLLYKCFGICIKINKALLSDILIAMVGVAGVFLGLYCSYISTIFSSKYANCPKEMSKLFENDFITDKSIKAIVNYIIFSIIIILFSFCSYTIGIVTILVNILSGIYVIVSYIHIGKRILRMTDTYFVSESLYRKIYSYINRITIPHPFSKDNTLQYNNKNFTTDALEKLITINNYNLSYGNHKKISILEFMQNNLFLISHYLDKKPLIPYDSLWFKSEGYKKWYNASDSEISIAIQTGTNISNTEVFDKYWFETKILEINKKSLDKLVENNSIEQIINYINSLQIVLTSAVKTNNIDYFSDVLKEVQLCALNALKNENSDILKMSLVENIIALYISLVLEIRKHFNCLNIKIILEDAVNQNYSNKETFIYCNNAEIKKLFDGINLEERIEKCRITPDWYINQLVAKYIYTHIIHCCRIIDIITNESTLSLATEMMDKKEYACATIIYSTALELINKVQSTIPVLESIITKVTEYNKDHKNYIWEDYDVSKFKNRTQLSYNEMPKNWSKCATAFALNNWSDYDKYPDLLGLCYNNICDYLVKAIAHNEFENFKNTYCHLLTVVLVYQDLSRRELSTIKEPYKQNVVIATLCSPILEFGYISGYAFLWSEISGNNGWKELIKSNFDKTIQTYGEQSHDLCIQIAAMLNAPTLLRPAIYSRSIIHTQWKQIIEESFCSSGYIKWKQQGFSETIDTSNQLLKKLINSKSDFELLSIEAYELFAIFILNTHLEKDKKFKSRTGWENEIE